MTKVGNQKCAKLYETEQKCERKYKNHKTFMTIYLFFLTCLSLRNLISQKKGD